MGGLAGVGADIGAHRLEHEAGVSDGWEIGQAVCHFGGAKEGIDVFAQPVRVWLPTLSRAVNGVLASPSAQRSARTFSENTLPFMLPTNSTPLP